MGELIGDENWAWVLGHAAVWAMVAARVMGLCFTAPVLAIPELDWRFRLVLTMLLSAVLIPVLEPMIASPVDLPSAGWGLLLEVLTGGILGWSAALVIAGARLGGELVAAQAGLSTASLFDPESGEETTVLGRLYGWIALAVFLVLNGPLILVGALVESYRAVPASGLLISRDRRNGLPAGGPGDGAIVASGRACRAGLDLGGPRAGLVKPGRAVAAVCRAGIANPHCSRCRVDRAQFDHTGRHARRHVGHISFLTEGPSCPRIEHNRRRSDADSSRVSTGRPRTAPELTAAVGWVTAIVALWFMGDDLGPGAWQASHQLADRTALMTADPIAVAAKVRGLILGLGWPLGSIVLGFAAGALAAHQVQVRGLWAPGLLVPDLSRLWAFSSGPGFADRCRAHGLVNGQGSHPCRGLGLDDPRGLGRALEAKQPRRADIGAKYRRDHTPAFLRARRGPCGPRRGRLRAPVPAVRVDAADDDPRATRRSARH